jgi:hypothetical protein
MAIRLLRNALNSIVPTWLSNRVGLNSGFKVLYTIAVIGDCYLEGVWEGFQAALGIGTATALPYLGQARGLLQGPGESDTNFRGRLQNYLSTWEDAGKTELLLQTLQVYLTGQGTLGAGVLPTVTHITRQGYWTTLNPDGTFTRTLTLTPWDWDEALGADDGSGHYSGATVATWWADFWIAISPPSAGPIFPIYSGTDDPDWIANFGPLAVTGMAFKIPLATAFGILSLINLWKGAHAYCRAVIWPDAPFSPTTLDGTWGGWSKDVSGVQTPGRNTTYRFMIPPGGG